VHHVVSTEELIAAELSEGQIAHLVAIGVLYRVHHGVYAVGRPQLTFTGHCRAAWLACGGPGCAVSHISAAGSHNFRRAFGRIHVSGPRSLDGHPGLIVHRPRSLPLAEIVEHDGYAVTSVARTILDMAPGQTVDTVGEWLHEAGVQRVLDVRDVWTVLQRHRHHRGARIVEAALALEVLDTRTGLEDAMLAIWRRAGLPRVVANDWVWTELGLEEVDFHGESLGLVLEVDGDRYHHSRWRKRRDAAKDARVRATGKVVVRVPELAITLDPDGVAAELRELAATRGPGNWSVARVSPPTP
jgi:hypothetical protein